MIEKLISEGLTSELFAALDAGLMQIFVVAVLASLGVCAINIATERWHGIYSFDWDVKGIQKVHHRTVPRTGGIALASGVIAVPLLAGSVYPDVFLGEESRNTMILLWLTATPAFLAGIAEDVTKKVSVRLRFCSILASALLAAWMLGARLPRLDFFGIDAMLTLVPVSVLVTAFAVVGVTNAVNIIDGFNGVAGAAVVIILAGVGYLCWREGDVLLAQLALAGMGATVGFLLLNYPTGRLFMGDGGAYFLGFWAAELAVLAVARNPGIITWQLLAVFAYPVIEVLFSIYRRKILRDTFAGAPDRLHLHSLFYRRIARQKLSLKRYPWMCNAGVACFVTTWISSATVAAILFGNTVAGALALVALQVLGYIAFYMRLVRGHWGHCFNPAVIFGLLPQHARFA
ncbi:MAG: glycosyl transferase 4 family protein [Lysobacteraceae bacterium]|nr:MAG: glycosyl transferase 4 family protein [Xanthomonadaceae bacterium]